MSDLTLGGGTLADGWGFPSPLFNYETMVYETKGMVWMKNEPATKDDVEALYRSLGHLSVPENVEIDWPTCLCLPSFFTRNAGKHPYKQTIVL